MDRFKNISWILAFTVIFILQTQFFHSEVAAIPVLVGDSVGDLYSIDSDNGTSTLIGDMGVTMFDIAQDGNGHLFGISASSTLSSSLYSINTANAASTFIGNLGIFSNALAFDSAGRLFASGDDSLYTVDRFSGSATLIGANTGIASSGDLAFAPNGDLFLTASPSSGGSGDRLLRLDPGNGNGTIIGNINFDNVFGLAFDGNTLLGTSDSGQIITIDTFTGAGTLLSTSSISAFGATNPAPVPEPSSIILLASGLAGIIAFRNKKRKAT